MEFISFNKFGKIILLRIERERNVMVAIPSLSPALTIILEIPYPPLELEKLMDHTFGQEKDTRTPHTRTPNAHQHGRPSVRIFDGPDFK